MNKIKISTDLVAELVEVLDDGARAMAASNRARARGDARPLFFAPSRIKAFRGVLLRLAKLAELAGDNDAGVFARAAAYEQRQAEALFEQDLAEGLG